MKKIITAVTALIAMSVAFMSCGFTDGAAEPQYDYQKLNLDLDGLNTVIGNYPNQFEVKGSNFSPLDGQENPKITVNFVATEGSNWFQVQIFYGNNPDDSDDGWKTYNKLLNSTVYDAQGNKITLTDDGFIKNNDKLSNTTFVLKPNKEQLAALIKRGLVLQGANVEIKEVILEYVGEKAVITNVKNIAKADGSFSGKGEILLDPENANITTWTIDSDGRNNVDATYTFKDKADLSKSNSLTLNARTNFKLVNDSNIISKVSDYSRELKLAYNIYTLAVSDGSIKDTSGESEITVPKGVLYNSYNKNKAIYIKDIYPDYEGDAEDYAYGKNVNELGTDKSEAFMADGNTWSDYHCGYVYKDSACNEKVTKSEANDIKITIFTDDDYASSITYKGPYSADYDNITLNIADFTKSGEKDAVKISKVKGFKISTLSSKGTLYIKSFEF